MRALRSAAVVAAAVVMLMVGAGPASAQPTAPVQGDPWINPNPSSEGNQIGAAPTGRRPGRTGTPGSQGSGTSPYEWCTVWSLEAGEGWADAWFLYRDEETGAYIRAPVGGMGFHFSDPEMMRSGPTERTDFSVCGAGNDMWIDPIVPGVPPQAIIDFLIEQAYRATEVPYPVPSSAPSGEGDAPMITQLPTWLWIDGAIWSPVSVTPPAIFGLTVTVTATPANVSFAGGGQRVDCGANTGSVYDFSLPDGAQTTSCQITYRDASSVVAASLTADMSWDVTWLCEPGCGSGTLPPMALSDTIAVTVAEMEALLTSS